MDNIHWIHMEYILGIPWLDIYGYILVSIGIYGFSWLYVPHIMWVCMGIHRYKRVYMGVYTTQA